MAVDTAVRKFLFERRDRGPNDGVVWSEDPERNCTGKEARVEPVLAEGGVQAAAANAIPADRFDCNLSRGSGRFAHCRSDAVDPGRSA